jgi:pyruvate dehydrogenase E2 component (dihydrolipoamide acetyltransferase)
MAEIVTMPKLGFDMAEGTLVRWVVSEGEEVSKGMVLAEIETDKATVEVESSYDGVILRHLISEGEVVPINTPIAVVGNKDEEVDVSELVGEIEPKSIPEVKTEAVETEIEEPGEIVEEEIEEIISPREDPEVAQLPGGVRASPLARRMAEEHDLDLKAIKGSGPRGRIEKKDIESFLEEKPQPERLETMKKEIRVPAPTMIPEIETREIPLSRLRATIGRRMVESTQQVPQFFITHEYNMAAVMDLRKQINSLLPEEDKISVNDFIVKAVSYALREYPNLNASLSKDQDSIIQHGDVNVGVAVAVENGLLTVVCRNVDIKPIRQISSELRAMVQRARDGKVRIDDIEGSTFTVSNLGMFDVEHFTAIINPPEAAILAVGAVREIPVIVDGSFTSGLRMKATLTVDHRVSDGAEGALFLDSLVKYLEKPLRLLV